MRARQKVTRAGIELIASFEGLRHRAARLPDGRWTIGYGHTLSAREGAEVSLEDAQALLHFDLLPVVEAVNGLVYTPLTDNQFDALVAFAFNVGVDAFRTSDVLKRVNEGRLTEAACALDLWRKADIGGDPVILDALIRRRAAEKALFLTPHDGFVPTPSPLVRPMVDVSLAPALPASRPVEIETPMEGATAEVHRLGSPEPEASPEPVDVTVSEAEPADAQPQDAVAVEAAYSDEAVADTPAEPQSDAIEASPPVAGALADSLDEEGPAFPGMEAAGPGAGAAVESPEEAVAARDVPAEAEPALPAAEVVAAASAAARIYAPEETPAAEPAPETVFEPAPTSEAAGDVRYEPQPLPAFAPPPQGDFSPQPAEVSPASMLGAAAPAMPGGDLPPAPPVVTTDTAAPASVWTLTPPPAELAEPPQRVVFDHAAVEPDERQSPLFDDSLAEQNLERIIRHEESEAILDESDKPSSGPFILVGAIGFAAFGGAVSAFLKARAGTGGLDELTVIAWILALIGAGCVGTAVYFLLKRLGGVED